MQLLSNPIALFFNRNDQGKKRKKTKNKNYSLLYDLLNVTTEIRVTPSDAKERV
jgi:hypothetical protein